MQTYGRLVVHAGLHRTGTTSLQYQLRTMVDAKEVRLRVPEVHPTRSLLSQPVLSDLARDLDAFQASDGPTLVVSNESLLGHFSSGYAEGPARCRELASILPPTADSSPVVVLRPFIDWLESGYRTSVREGSVDLPEDYAERVLSSSWSSWPRLAEDFLATFPSSSPMVLPLPRGMDSTAMLIDALSLPVTAAGAAPRERLNRSLSATHIAWLRAMNALGELDPHHRNVIVDVLHTDFPTPDASDSVFTDSLRRELEIRSTTDWRDLLDVVRDSMAQHEVLREWGSWDLVHSPKTYGGVVQVGDPAVASMVSFASNALLEQAGRRAGLREKITHALGVTMRRQGSPAGP